MRTTLFFAGIFSVGLMVPDANVAFGQDYPNRPIRVVTSGAGGSSDFASRLIAPVASASLGQQMVVDNRGNNAGEIVSRAPADGYTLLVDGASHWIGPLLQSAPYDAVTDFSPITLVARAPHVLVVHPSVAASSVKELIAFAKASPGKLNYGSGGSGGATHLAVELFKVMSGVNFTRINYKGSGAAVSALIGGEVQLMITSVSSVSAQVKSGKLKVLALTTAQPSALLPGVPTVAASGVPGFVSVSMTGMFAPAKTPAATINRLNQEIVRILNRADVKERFLNAGVETVGSLPQELANDMKAEIATWGKVIKEAGIAEK